MFEIVGGLVFDVLNVLVFSHFNERAKRNRAARER
jgi:hypothetical protein